MKFGLASSELSLLQDIVVNPLKSLGASVWIFGSRAREEHKPFSDIDLLFELPKTVLIPTGKLYEIKSNAEESKLPYKVDLVNIEDLAESYRDNVMADRVML